MHIVTFYSFKGGVGRTLALANVAHELSRSGKRLLLVDFDLEAPGLDTIARSPEAYATRGVVDYVSEYLAGDAAPDVREFVYEAADQLERDTPGRVLVMPAGIQDSDYARRLSSIDWVNLYAHHDGYLLFEDLKAQWADRLNVDYVLVDSRTGYTDVAGICTRQLPDSVVITFFPNDQNLRGIERIVSDIRREPHVSGRKAIDLLFVASNVPQLDDEESILRRRLATFRRTLKANDLHVIHHYDSLALLAEPVFTRERPRSRLARQYRELTKRIRMLNVEDKGGVLALLDEPRRWLPRMYTEGSGWLSEVESKHARDGDVLFQLGNVRSHLGQVAEAKDLYEQALSSGLSESMAQVYVQLAEAYQRLGDLRRAAGAAARIFDDPSAGSVRVQRAVELIRLADAEGLARLVDSPAVAALGLTERVELASGLDRNVEERRIAYKVVEPLRDRGTTADERSSVANALGLCLIALRDFDEAERVLDECVTEMPEEVAPWFNLAMARWALSGRPDAAAMRKVLELPIPPMRAEAPNTLQCLAVARWAVGEEAEARTTLQLSRAAIRRRSGREFSCWRYLSASPRDFERDLASIERMLGGEGILPSFMAPPEQLSMGIMPGESTAPR